MNAAGLKVIINNVAEIINSSVWFDRLTSEGISADELKGTRQEATALAKALKATPSKKIESLVAHYDAQLTHALRVFQSDWQLNFLKGFRDAQVVIGFVTSLCNKAGIRT
jgi:phage terminase large subunit-like protein